MKAPEKKLTGRKIRKVRVDGFWGDKIVEIDFKQDINFLIGVNGSGKTTIINLIAASLNADFATLDKSQFRKIQIDFFSLPKEKEKPFLIVEKVEKTNSPFSNIIVKIKFPGQSNITEFELNEIEEDAVFRYYPSHNEFRRGKQLQLSYENDIKSSLNNLVNLTWLSIHRTSSFKHIDDKSFESTIDLKIKELTTDLVKYFGVLDRKYSQETEKFQKNIFLSLIETQNTKNTYSFTNNLDAEAEKESLKQIFLLFKLKEDEFSARLDNHFNSFETAKNKLTTGNLDLDEFALLVDTKRIHSIVQEWIDLNMKKNEINKPKATFIDQINMLFQRKKVVISERNELQVETQSGKVFAPSNLSSGEKQLLIILGQCLLQENNNHIYIADEPELSLHIEWQEKLVGNLKNLNPNAQIIFATHSPDIVSTFSKAIINIEEVIKDEVVE